MTDLIVEELDGILWARINRTTKANSISRSVTDSYAAALRQLETEPDLRGLIWTSVSDALFSGGVDLARPDHFTDQQVSEFRTSIITDLLMATLNCSRPVVTATRGQMIGGAFLNALCCDRIIADPAATFQLPEVRIGIGSPIAASVVERAATAALAQDLLLTAREITAAELAASGGPCTPARDVEDTAVKTIETYASMPREAFAYMKSWFQAPRRAVLQAAMEHTAKTRANNNEITAAVAQFFAKR